MVQDIIYRTPIVTAPLAKLPTQTHYTFTIVLADETSRIISGIAPTPDAMQIALARAGKMIEKGYQEGM